MRRWFAVLLLVVLSLQLPWAAAAKYCTHDDGGSTSAHFGHHEHAHPASDTSPSGGDHSDCGVCHLSAAKAIEVVRDLPPPTAERKRLPPAAIAGYASAPERPRDRPNWLRTV